MADAVTAPVKGMTWIPGGAFAMGSDAFYPEERPVRRVEVEGFWIDRHPVTVRRSSRRFVGQTGYVTVAERPLDPADYPDADPDALVPGSLVFQQDRRPGRPARRPQLVALRAGRGLAASPRGRLDASPGASATR